MRREGTGTIATIAKKQRGCRRMIWAVIWYYLHGLFTIADIITTKIALASGYHEANPFMVPVVDNLIGIKFAFLLVTIVLIYFTERTAENHGWVIPASGCCVTFAAVLSSQWAFRNVCRSQTGSPGKERSLVSRGRTTLSFASYPVPFQRTCTSRSGL